MGHAGVPDRRVAPFLPNLDSSNKPPDPGATSQGPAGGAYGLVCLLVATYIPSFPLRVKGELCVDMRRPLNWAVGDHFQLEHLSRRGGGPIQWRAPGELSLRHLPDRILASGWGVRSVTKAPPSEFTLPDLHHQRHRIAVPVCLLSVAQGGVCPA